MPSNKERKGKIAPKAPIQRRAQPRSSTRGKSGLFADSRPEKKLNNVRLKFSVIRFHNKMSLFI